MKMRATLVFDMKDSESTKAWPEICKTLEGCLTVVEVKWKLEDGVAVVIGETDQSLSTIMTAVFCNPHTVGRIRGLDYKPSAHR